MNCQHLMRKGIATTDRALDMIEKLLFPQMTQYDKLVIYCDVIKTMYIFDRTNAKKDYKFTLPLKDVPGDIRELSFVSCT